MKKVYLKKSGIAGRGIFAGEDMSAGDFVMPLTGKIIHKVYKHESDLRIGKTWVSVGRHLWLNPVFPVKYMNHCCDANLGFKTPRRLYARKQIKKDDELTIDYSTVEYVLFWKMKCGCSSKKCRKVVGPVQSLSRATYESYLPFIPRFFQDVYLKYKNGNKK